MNSLITITEKEIGARHEQCVNGRDLHKALEIETRFNDWIKRRIDEYGFQQGIDYETFSENGKSHENEDLLNFEKNPQGGRPYVEYSLTVEMAKELCMIEKNEKGRMIRKYFLDCERRLKDVNTADSGIFATGLWAGIALNRVLERNGFDLADMARFVWYRQKEITQREVAKIFGITRDKAREIEKMLKASGVSFPDICSSKRSKEMRDVFDNMLGFKDKDISLHLVRGGAL